MIGHVPETLEVPNDQPWIEDFNFWVGRRKGTPLNLESARMIMRRRQPGAELFELTIGNSRLAMSGNSAGPRVSVEDMATLDPDTYDFELLVEDVNGGPRQVRGVVQIVGSI